MKKATVVLMMLMTVGIATTLAALRREALVSFDGGIGVIPVLNVAGVMSEGTFPEVRRNVVRGVIPAIAPLENRQPQGSRRL